jgi:DNA-binding transcriptional LysR family regulator
VLHNCNTTPSDFPAAVTNWDDYRYFVSLIETGSVRASAARLGVNASTVTRRLDGLEGRLGVKLFVRSHAGLTVTSDGEELMVALRPLVAGLGELENRLSGRGGDAVGSVRITMADVFAITLMSEFSEFSRAHPLIRLEFLPDYRILDLARGEADMAIRVTAHPPEALVGRLLGRYRLALYGSRAYLARFDPAIQPEACTWIESGLEAIRAPAFKSRHYPAVPLGPCCNNLLLLHAAVAAHMGITLLPCVIGDADRSLKRVGDHGPMDAQEIWLLFHPDLRGVARIQSVSGFVQEAFERLESRLLGHDTHES